MITNIIKKVIYNDKGLFYVCMCVLMFMCEHTCVAKQVWRGDRG